MANSLRCGFMFAFFKYSRMQSAGVVEKVAHYALKDDEIHVAIVPAPVVHTNEWGVIDYVVLGKSAFTAFMWYGYEKNSVESVLRSEYEYIFLPVEQEAFVRGVKFLMSLQGKQYNYIDLLPVTIFPHSWKMKHQITKQTYEQPHAARVFCSQVGLMLCYECDVFCKENNENPAYCSPRELYDLIIKEGGGLHVDAEAIAEIVTV